jgi:hypothetical protein
MGGLRAEFAAGTETPHPSHRKKQALPAVHPNSKPCCARIMEWPAMAEWVTAAREEPEEIEELDMEF